MSFVVPRSLFGRMVWVLLMGLIVAQLLSMAIHRHERSRTVARTGSLMAAQRIRDIVTLLDTVDNDSRKLIVDKKRKGVWNSSAISKRIGCVQLKLERIAKRNGLEKFIETREITHHYR